MSATYFATPLARLGAATIALCHMPNIWRPPPRLAATSDLDDYLDEFFTEKKLFRVVLRTEKLLVVWTEAVVGVFFTEKELQSWWNIGWTI